MIQDIGPYTYVSALDLSMAFYHMELSEELKQMCTFVLPWSYTTKIINNPRVMRWRLLIEEYQPMIKYLPGEKNEVADALSRLPISLALEEQFHVAECFDMAPLLQQYVTPVSFKEIRKEQEKDPFIQKVQRESPDSLSTVFDDIGLKEGPDSVYTYLDKQSGEQKIVVPKSLQQQLTLWYHTQLIHPGVERLYNTLKQHYVWPKMKETIAITLRSCDACQKAKRGGRGMGLIPLKDTEKGPWRDVAVDLAGPWKARINSKNVKFHALTIIDPFTCWVEVIPIKGKTGEYMRDLIEQQWLRRYPRPERIIFDQGGKFDNQWM